MDCTSPVFGQYPCGHCANCRARLRQEWVFRLRMEYQACDFGLFVTLTYNDDRLPPDGVSKRDVQLFMKRFRKRLCSKFNDRKYSDMCRYYICSEYGDHGHRAHYHGLLFFRIPRTPDIYDIIEESWQNGFVQFGEIEEGSIVYCTKYCLKGSDVPPGMNPNFRLLSKMSGGIGVNHIIGDLSDFYTSRLDEPQVVSYHDQSSPMPRYYRTKLLNSLDPDDREQIKIMYQENLELRKLKQRQKLLKRFRSLFPEKDPDELVSYGYGVKSNFDIWLLKRSILREEAIKNHTKKQNLL